MVEADGETVPVPMSPRTRRRLRAGIAVGLAMLVFGVLVNTALALVPARAGPGDAGGVAGRSGSGPRLAAVLEGAGPGDDALAAARGHL